jgi:predicted phage terminase large subunit-like protein
MPKTTLTALETASLDEIRNEFARRQLLAFTERTNPKYRAGWFHKLVAERLDSFLIDVEAMRSPRLIITCPPQHGKSELTSRRFPAYALGRNPDLKIIAASYAADRAFDFSNDVQRIIDSRIYHEIFPYTRIVGQYAKAMTAKRSAALFQVVGHHGRYRAAGILGGITGEPADVLIVDDPVKDFAEAISEATRESVWNWFTATAMPRVQEGGGVIVIMTRWHLDDLAGRLVEKQPGVWRIVNFPAIAEHDEPPYRLAGEPLSPERYSLEYLVSIRDGGATSTYQWEALYQQNPSPIAGGIFKRDDWQFYRDLPESFSETLQSWDCTFKDTRGSDFVVGQVWGISGAGRYLLDQVRGQLTFSQTLAAIRQVSAKWPQAHRKLIEDKANGSAVIDTLRSEIPGLIAVNPEGGKEARAHAVSAFVQGHNVYLPADASWVPGFIEECAQFPSGKHDDQVDAMTQALNYARGARLVLGLTELGTQYINASKSERLEIEMRAGLWPQLESKGDNTVIEYIEAQRGCPKCGSSRYVKGDPLGTWWRCNACLFVWRGPQPTGGAIDVPTTARPESRPAPPPEGNHCPSCGWGGVAVRGATRHCSRCGHEVFVGLAPVSNAVGGRGGL